MKAKITIALFTVAILTACNSGKPSAVTTDSDEVRTKERIVDPEEQTEKIPEYDPTDAQSFGLKGHVQTVNTYSYSTYESEGELKVNDVAGQAQEMSFDPWGHVTRDEWGNEYGYDAEGNYYRGNHIYTTIIRDKEKRITKYVDEEPKTDNEANKTLTFSYDKKGRLITVSQNAWTGHWVEKRTYDKNNIYPSKIENTSDDEGGGSSTLTFTYHYNSFDEYGNWTERTCIMSETETEEDPWSEAGEQTKIKETIIIEKRTMVYYD